MKKDIKKHFSKKKSREDKLADTLVKLSERNGKLKEKKMNTDWLDFF